MVPHGRVTGVRLAVKPLQPKMIGARSAAVTLDEVTELAERFDASACGVIVDAYHVVSDWLSFTTNDLTGLSEVEITCGELAKDDPGDLIGHVIQRLDEFV